jgi:iron complex transport system substrate-binding protein
VTDALAHLGCTADVLTLDPYTLDEVLATIVAVGARTGVVERAERLVAGLRSRLAAVAAAVDGRRRPRVAAVEWVDPWSWWPRAGSILTEPSTRPDPSLPGSSTRRCGRSTPTAVVRPGPRLVDGVEAIAAILHPGAVPEPPEGSIARVAPPWRRGAARH